MIFAMKNWLGVCALIGLISLAGRPASAAVSLADLINNSSSVIVGGTMVFDQFTYSATVGMPSANGILVDALVNGSGIRVQGGFDDFAGGGPSVVDITYRVSTLDPGLTFSAATLMGNPVIIGTGDFTITQTFAGVPTSLSIFDTVPGSSHYLSTLDLPSGLSSLNVALSIAANATTGAGTASIVDQSFGVVPEPNSAAIWLGTLMVCGVVSMTVRRWSQISQLVLRPTRR
jgi:hypothetical protein